MKRFQPIPLAIGVVCLAGITTLAQESKTESPTLSATDKIEIIETIEVTSKKELDSSNSEGLDDEIVAILEEAEADATVVEGKVKTLTKTKIQSKIDESTLTKNVDKGLSGQKKITMPKTATSAKSEGKLKLKTTSE